MNVRKTVTAVLGALALSAAALLPQATLAATPEVAAREINHLLEHVGSSGCEFYRNGIWYKGNLGEVHLRDKYDWLSLRNMIEVTGDFIDKGATQSSMTGLEYKVRCPGRETVTSRQWLNEELQRYRASAH